MNLFIRIVEAYEEFAIFHQDQLHSHGTLPSILRPTNENGHALNSVTAKRRRSSQINDRIELIDSNEEANAKRARVIKSETQEIDIDDPDELEYFSAMLSWRYKDRGMNEQEHLMPKNRTIQMNDSSVETIDGRRSIKAEPAEITSCRTTNKKFSNNHGAIIDISDDEEVSSC